MRNYFIQGTLLASFCGKEKPMSLNYFLKCVRHSDRRITKVTLLLLPTAPKDKHRLPVFTNEEMETTTQPSPDINPNVFSAKVMLCLLPSGCRNCIIFPALKEIPATEGR